MFYSRKILPALEQELETREIVVLTGMRQVGKTTILNRLFAEIASSNKVLLDLGNPLHRKVFEEENFDNIWNNLKQFGVTNGSRAYLFLDEIQNLPQISQVVKYLYDHWSVKFFLTVSASFYLKNLFPESLAGRKLVFELFPLTFAEFLTFGNVKRESTASFSQKAAAKNKIGYEKIIKYYQEFMEFGGFPLVVLEENFSRKRQLLEEIFKSYFEQDVKSLADFKEIAKLRDLILLLPTRIGAKVEVGKLASELAVSRETVYNYLGFLEQTYFISLLPQFSQSADRQAAGGKKLFFGDTGLANLLGKISLGQAFENSVFQNLRPDFKLQYFHRGAGGEIDFVVEGKIGLEAKTTASAREVANLVKRAKGPGLTENYLVTLNYSEEKKAVLATDL
ncbi:ATP-binding protein [Candidatus Shapirobacteria bacterium]|nr:ATP-binding protein [Candidatus Shapirobacteria bacterium]